jgi:hypothetical protein
MAVKPTHFKTPQRPYRPLDEQISFIGIESCFFSHKGVNYEIMSTNVNPHVHTIKNCESGATSDILHTRLLALSQS